MAALPVNWLELFTQQLANPSVQYFLFGSAAVIGTSIYFGGSPGGTIDGPAPEAADYEEEHPVFDHLLVDADLSASITPAPNIPVPSIWGHPYAVTYTPGTPWNQALTIRQANNPVHSDPTTVLSHVLLPLFLLLVYVIHLLSKCCRSSHATAMPGKDSGAAPNLTCNPKPQNSRVHTTPKSNPGTSDWSPPTDRAMTPDEQIRQPVAERDEASDERDKAYRQLDEAVKTQPHTQEALQAANAKVKATEAGLILTEKRVKELKQSPSAPEGAIVESVATQEHAKEFGTQIGDLQQKLDEAQTQRDESIREVDRVNTRTSDLQEQLVNATAKAKVTEANLAEQQKHNQEQRKQLDDRNDDLERIKSKNKDLREEFEGLRLKLHKVQGLNKDLETRNDKLAQELEAVKRTSDQELNDLHGLHKGSNESAQKELVPRNQLKDANARADRAEADSFAANQRAGDLRSECDDYESKQKQQAEEASSMAIIARIDDGLTGPEATSPQGEANKSVDTASAASAAENPPKDGDDGRAMYEQESAPIESPEPKHEPTRTMDLSAIASSSQPTLSELEQTAGESLLQPPGHEARKGNETAVASKPEDVSDKNSNALALAAEQVTIHTSRPESLEDKPAATTANPASVRQRSGSSAVAPSELTPTISLQPMPSPRLPDPSRSLPGIGASRHAPEQLDLRKKLNAQQRTPPTVDTRTPVPAGLVGTQTCDCCGATFQDDNSFKYADHHYSKCLEWREKYGPAAFVNVNQTGRNKGVRYPPGFHTAAQRPDPNQTEWLRKALEICEEAGVNDRGARLLEPGAKVYTAKDGWSVPSTPSGRTAPSTPYNRSGRTTPFAPSPLRTSYTAPGRGEPHTPSGLKKKKR